ncbi:MAG: DUF4340 domain-containing protein, partial [Elstera sp.]
MQTRSLLLLLALSAASAVGAGITLQANQPTRSLPAGVKLFANLATQQSQVTRITLTQGKEKLTLVRQGDTWGLAEKSNYPVAPEKIRQILVDLTEAETLEGKTSKPELYSRLNVDEGEAAASRRLTLYGDKDAVLADVFLGKTRASAVNAAALGLDKPMLYLRKAGDAQAFLVESRLNPEVEALEWLAKDLFDLPQEKVSAVSLTGADGAVIEIARAADATPPDFVVTNPPEGRVSKKGWDVTGIAATLEAMALEDVRPAASLPADAPKSLSRFTFTEGAPITLSLVKADGAEWAVFEGENEALKATKGWAYKLPSYKLERLQKSMADLTEEPKS